MTNKTIMKKFEELNFGGIKNIYLKKIKIILDDYLQHSKDDNIPRVELLLIELENEIIKREEFKKLKENERERINQKKKLEGDQK